MKILKTLGIVLGIGLLFALVVAFAAGAMSRGESMAGLVVFAAATIIGFPLGVIVGIIVANKAFHQKGSLTLGILGTILGIIVTFLLIMSEQIRHAPFGIPGMVIVAFLLPLALGLLCFLLKGSKA